MPLLDTASLVETPEGISLRLRPAGVVPRAAAWAIDFAARGGIVMALAMVAALLGEAGGGIYLLGLFAVYWAYPVVFEVLRDGQTLGKQAMGLRVVNANGTPVTWMPSIVRNLMRTVDMLPFAYGFGLVAGLFDPQSRRFGDMVAGTLVVHADTPRRAIPAPNVPVFVTAAALPPGDRAAIVAFAERAPQLTEARQQELAGLLAPITGVPAGPVAVQRTLGIASAVLGRR